jgi:hypothetical protein
MSVELLLGVASCKTYANAVLPPLFHTLRFFQAGISAIGKQPYISPQAYDQAIGSHRLLQSIGSVALK